MNLAALVAQASILQVLENDSGHVRRLVALDITSGRTGAEWANLELFASVTLVAAASIQMHPGSDTRLLQSVDLSLSLLLFPC